MKANHHQDSLFSPCQCHELCLEDDYIIETSEAECRTEWVAKPIPY